MTHIIETAERKLKNGLITQKEYEIILGCDALAALDEEGFLQHSTTTETQQGMFVFKAEKV